MWDYLSHMMARIKYPVSLPEEVAEALGVDLPCRSSFDEFIKELMAPQLKPTKLVKYMTRERAEALFGKAVKTERFNQKTLISYYFNRGWLEFMLQFDDESRLRRIYFYHQATRRPEGVEIPLIFRG